MDGIVDPGTWDWLARASAWPVVVLGLCATRSRGAVRWWRAGWVALLLHEAAAFWLVHGGSHGRAVADTARQVAGVTGWEFGPALYVNHAFTLAWTAMVLVGRRCPVAVGRVWDGVFLFFAFQGAVVFARGWGRWLGLVLFGVWLADTVRTRRLFPSRGAADAGPAA